MATQKAKPLTLTVAAAAMRKAIIAVGITLCLFIFGRVFYDSAKNYWIATHPAPPPAPTVAFGILPKLVFPESAIKPTGFQLQVPMAQLQPVSDRAYVFVVRKKIANLLAVDKAKVQARTLGFMFDPEPINEEVYRWRRNEPLPSVLDYNTVQGTFTLRVDWQANPAFLQGSLLPNEDAAINITRQTISGVGLLPKDMATGSAKVTYLKSSGNSYTNTVSFSEADFLQVDLFRTSVFGKYPILTERPNKGTIRAIISGNRDRDQQVIALEYNHLPVEYGWAETYPILTPTAAFQLLSSGQGYSASIAEGQAQAVIRSVYLAYYDSGSRPQKFLQPIYVFEGDGGYVGYVPAVVPQYLTP